MILIEVTLPNGKRRQESLDKESVMIGKAPGNDVVLDADGISRYHARLVVEAGELTLEDVGSTNGTFVNGAKVTKTTLNRGDKVTLGAVLLQAMYENVSADATETESTAHATTGTVSAPRPNLEQANIAAQLEPAEDPPEGMSRDKKEDAFYWEALSSFLQPVWHYITDDAVSEIMINGPDEIFIEKKGRLTRVNERFTPDALHAAVLNIAQYVGRRVDEHEPYLDARLPDGSRVAVLLPPCARKGISISIRKFGKERLTLDKLIEFGALTAEMVTFLRAAVVLKKNIIVAGGTSSGKTSLLNVISRLIPQDERILTIEDSAELQLSQDHILPMETKPPDKKGRGQITIRDLVKASLRMRPDRIIVGEIRGGEAIDLLQAMNTGHSGSMATVHASSPTQSLTRLETLALFSGLDIPMRALREQVASAVDIVIQASRLPDKSRKVTHISEVAPLKEDGSYQTYDIFRFTRTGMSAEGKLEGHHGLTGNIPAFMEEMELSGMTEAIELFGGAGVRAQGNRKESH